MSTRGEYRSAGVDWERRELTGEALVETPPFLLPNELLRTAPPAAAFFRPGTMDMARANSLFAQHASSREGTRRFQRSQPRTPSRVRRRPPPPRASSCCPAAPCEEGGLCAGSCERELCEAAPVGPSGSVRLVHTPLCACVLERGTSVSAVGNVKIVLRCALFV